MMNTRTWALALVPFALAACESDREAAGGGLDGDTVAAATDTTRDPVAVQESQPVSREQQVEFRAIGGSGVGGTATIVAPEVGDDSAMVTLRLTGAPGGPLPAHVHTGTCDSLGPVVVPLESAAVDGTGAATSSTTVPIPMRTLMDGRHVIAVHGATGAPIACTPIVPSIPN